MGLSKINPLISPSSLKINNSEAHVRDFTVSLWEVCWPIIQFKYTNVNSHELRIQ